MFYLLFLVLCSDLSLAHWSDCQVHIPSEGINLTPIPDKEELDELCPGILKYLDCYGNEMAENPQDFEDSNVMFHHFLGLLLYDLCTEGTEMRTDYLSSVECFRKIQSKYDPCYKTAESVYFQYKNATQSEGLVDETPSDEKECFSKGHAVECMAKEIQKTCGSLEHSTYLRLVGGSRYMYKFCQQSTIEDFITKYLEYLNVDGVIRNMIVVGMG